MVTPDGWSESWMGKRLSVSGGSNVEGYGFRPLGGRFNDNTLSARTNLHARTKRSSCGRVGDAEVLSSSLHGFYRFFVPKGFVL